MRLTSYLESLLFIEEHKPCTLRKVAECKSDQNVSNVFPGGYKIWNLLY